MVAVPLVQQRLLSRSWHSRPARTSRITTAEGCRTLTYGLFLPQRDSVHSLIMGMSASRIKASARSDRPA
jgi:hypothetical protein